MIHVEAKELYHRIFFNDENEEKPVDQNSLDTFFSKFQIYILLKETK